MRVRVSTPAGTLIVSDRRVRTRPSPEHSGQGRGLTVPKPAHCGQGRLVMTWPRNERWTLLISPRPRQAEQVTSSAPSAVIDPLHVGHTTAVSTWSSLV